MKKIKTFIRFFYNNKIVNFTSNVMFDQKKEDHCRSADEHFYEKSLF